MSDPTRNALNALQGSADRTTYPHNGIDASLLERFNNPANDHTPVKRWEGDSIGNIAMWEHISVPEFTCVCPVTGQPDFGCIDIYYAPQDWCVESKSLKLYIGSFRNVGTFHETVCTTIAHDINFLLMPVWLLVVGRFAPRGGIAIQPRAWVGRAPPELLFNIQRQRA